ncbi:hypothetical protein [Brevundimonas sp.]|uniref:hypothetical protein n=1 Tax=Brevundimonas sp. TaxID=1871086 RepID=UPI0028A9F566|nr:hypothetical protein [Brevundimonas sp.]
MALPTSGSISIDNIKNELGITGELSLMDQRVRDLAGIQSGSLTLPNDLWGKSARSISIYVMSHQTVQMGFGVNETYYDRIVFGVTVHGGGTPSSYMWSSDTFGQGATGEFNGPTYNANGWTYLAQGYADVSVVIDGRTYQAPSYAFNYTAGDLS